MTNPDAPTYEDLQMSVVLGRGIVVDVAPEHTKIGVHVVADRYFGLWVDEPGHIRIAGQVEYEITGYDPADCALTARLIRDWRPGQKDDPNTSGSAE
jgi:hypothetical protein